MENKTVGKSCNEKASHSDFVRGTIGGSEPILYRRGPSYSGNGRSFGDEARQVKISGSQTLSVSQ